MKMTVQETGEIPNAAEAGGFVAGTNEEGGRFAPAFTKVYIWPERSGRPFAPVQRLDHPPPQHAQCHEARAQQYE
jgi:hypothetical protein